MGNYEVEGAFLPEHIAILKSIGANLTPHTSYDSEGQMIIAPYYDIPHDNKGDPNDSDDWGMSQTTLVFLFDIPLARVPLYLQHSVTHDVPHISKDPEIGVAVWNDVVLPILKRRLELGI